MSGAPRGLPEPPAPGRAALPPGTFDGEVVLVTGGGTGLGRAISVEFARLGAAVGIVSRRAEHREAGVAAVREVGARAAEAACDIRDPDAVAGAFDRIERELGPVSVLVNNAAGNFPVPAEDLSPGGWRAVVEIVLHGTFFCSRELGRRLIGSGRNGSILNIGASYAWTGGPGFVHSAAAKAGVLSLTRTLAVEWAPYGIRVNALVPGLFPHEDETADIRSVPGRGASDEEASAPALRTGRLRELGWAATYLASPFAAYVTGHTMVVDGANWQRRALRQPAFVPVREQLGRGPFGSEEGGR